MGLFPNKSSKRSSPFFWKEGKQGEPLSHSLRRKMLSLGQLLTDVFRKGFDVGRRNHIPKNIQGRKDLSFFLRVTELSGAGVGSWTRSISS